MENFSIVFMEAALHEANTAFLSQEVPVGCVITKNGEIIGSGHNQVIKDNLVSSHAEIKAIENASHELINCDMYVTLEPCHMCAKAIVDARIRNLYFGALEPKTGAIVSIDSFLDASHLNHKVNYSSGYLASDAANLLKSFFRSKRS
jgi:tRNA(adenine34) deaminase